MPKEIMEPFALGGLGMPALRGIMANAVPDNMQGELQGAMTSIMSLTMIFGPLVMSWLFNVFTSADAPIYFPGAAHFAAGLLTAGALIALIVALRRHPLADDD
jgi:DHA1 family tetracycline resistance protein-like MFS transporter